MSFSELTRTLKSFGGVVENEITIITLPAAEMWCKLCPPLAIARSRPHLSLLLLSQSEFPSALLEVGSRLLLIDSWGGYVSILWFQDSQTRCSPPASPNSGPCTSNLNVMVVFISCPVNAFEFAGQCNPSNKCITGRRKKAAASTCICCTIYAVITYLHFSGP